MEVVTFEKQGSVALIRLNRPDSLNAFTRDVFDQLALARDRLAQDDELKVGILAGAGTRAFSAGIDLKSYSADLEAGGSRKIPHPLQVEMARGPRFSPKPLIAAIRGYCIGEGMHLALACDFRVCASDAVFALPEVALGMAQTWLSWQCVRVMGLPAATELCLLAEKKDATWARENRLVTQVTLPGEELAAARRIADRLCAMSWPAVMASRETLYRAWDMEYDPFWEYAKPLRDGVLDSGDDRRRSKDFVRGTG